MHGERDITHSRSHSREGEYNSRLRIMSVQGQVGLEVESRTVQNKFNRSLVLWRRIYLQPGYRLELYEAGMIQQLISQFLSLCHFICS